MQTKLTSFLALLAAMFVNVSAFAQGGGNIVVANPVQITDLDDLSEDNYYVLQNVGSGQDVGASMYLYYTGNDAQPLKARSDVFDYTSVVCLKYDQTSSTVQIKLLCTETYFQGLTSGAVRLGDSPANFTVYTITTDQTGEIKTEGNFRFNNNNNNIHFNSNGAGYVQAAGGNGELSQWKIWQVDLIDYPFANLERVTNVNSLEEDGYYILKNHGNGKYICSIPETANALGFKNLPDYSCVVHLTYDSEGNLNIQQASTGAYYQQLTSGNRLALGASPAKYTFNTDRPIAENCFRLENNNLYLNRDGSDTYPRALEKSLAGDFSQWEIYKVSKDLTLDEEKVPATIIEICNGGTFNVTLNRNFVEGFNTVVLPFALTAEQVKTVFGPGAEVYTYSETSQNKNDVTVTFESNTEDGIDANTPVLVKTTASTESKTLEGVTLDNNENPVVPGNFIDFTGVYTKQTIAAGNYFVNGDLYKSNGNTTIKPFRAYLQVKENMNQTNVKLMIGGTVTGIDSIDAAAKTEGEAVYNLLGQRVSKAQKGIYIVNGKKVVVK